MKLFILFVILNVVNVVLQTAKSIATMRCGKIVAAVANAVAYSLYTVVIIYTNCELPLFAKVAVVGITNLIGVYIVKAVEEKMDKEKLWKIEATVPQYMVEDFDRILDEGGIPHNYIENVGKYAIMNCYCETKHESALVKELLEAGGAKWFVSESKVL